MNPSVKIIDQGIIYRNPKPHIHSIQAYFPSLVDLGGGEMLCSFVLGEAFESADCRCHLARSHDGGITWEHTGRMFDELADMKYSEACRLTRFRDGNLASIVFRYDRSRKDEGLANPDNLGFVETEILLTRSFDNGLTWTSPKHIEPALVGPAFELCCPIIELANGDWLLPTSTWRGWSGDEPNGMKAVALVSKDCGDSWQTYVDVMDGSKDGIIYWEQKIVEYAPGKMLSVAWKYDEPNACDKPNAFCISDDNGQTFSKPQETDLRGQTPSLLAMGEDQVLCVYRRTDEPGLWAALASVAGGKWQTIEQLPLWGCEMAKQSENMVSNFNKLRFGAPTLTRLENGNIFLTFWRVDDCVSEIGWMLLGDALSEGAE